MEWVKILIEKVPIRLVFESALELMGSTQIGTFQVLWQNICRRAHLVKQSD